jgi:CcmD family protein
MKETAQQTAVEMADNFFNSNGKIYVVIGVVLIVLVGIFGYLFATERKLNRLEKELKK